MLMEYSELDKNEENSIQNEELKKIGDEIQIPTALQ